jgi:hypothetical protein
MNIRHTVLPATVAAIAITAAVVGGSFAAGADREPPAARQITVDIFINGVLSKGPIRGTVAASQAKAAISLHGVKPNTSYQVVASNKPCSAADATGSAVWQTDVQTGPGDDVFKIAAIDNSVPDGPVRIRSLSVVDNNVPDGPVRICTKAVTLRRVGGA